MSARERACVLARACVRELVSIVTCLLHANCKENLTKRFFVTKKTNFKGLSVYIY